MRQVDEWLRVRIYCTLNTALAPEPSSSQKDMKDGKKDDKKDGKKDNKKDGNKGNAEPVAAEAAVVPILAPGESHLVGEAAVRLRDAFDARRTNGFCWYSLADVSKGGVGLSAFAGQVGLNIETVDFSAARMPKPPPQVIAQMPIGVPAERILSLPCCNAAAHFANVCAGGARRVPDGLGAETSSTKGHAEISRGSSPAQKVALRRENGRHGRGGRDKTEAGTRSRLWVVPRIPERLNHSAEPDADRRRAHRMAHAGASGPRPEFAASKARTDKSCSQCRRCCLPQHQLKVPAPLRLRLSGWGRR